MSEQVFEGKSVDEALAEAASALGVGVEQLQHEVLEEKADDFWGLGDTIYRVRAWVPGSEPETVGEPEATAEAEPAADATPEPGAGAEARADEDGSSAGSAVAAETVPAIADDAGTPAATLPITDSTAPEAAGIETAAVSLLRRIFESMGFECSAEAAIDGGVLQVSISGDDNQYLLDGRGRGLAALELILNHAFRHRPDIGQHKIRVDAGDFRSQRDDEIRDLAYQVAHRAKETGEAQQTEPMNPYERRIVHLTLADDPQVSTRSLGSGFLKAVNVLPRRGGRR